MSKNLLNFNRAAGSLVVGGVIVALSSTNASAQLRPVSIFTNISNGSGISFIPFQNIGGTAGSAQGTGDLVGAFFNAVAAAGPAQTGAPRPVTPGTPTPPTPTGPIASLPTTPTTPTAPAAPPSAPPTATIPGFAFGLPQSPAGAEFGLVQFTLQQVASATPTRPAALPRSVNVFSPSW